MAYREFRARAELADVVTCTWQRDASNGGATRVLPDGCVDLVWRSGELVVAGPDRAAVLSPVDPGDAIVGLRLRPGTAGAMLGLPAVELRDRRVPLDAIWGACAAELGERIAAAATPADGRRLLETAVLERAETTMLDPVVLTASRWLGRPGARVATLSKTFATSERQMLRRFETAVGYGPKTLDRILRFQRFVARAGTRDLATLAAGLGYADQAHLSRECLRLSGLTPTELVAQWARTGTRSSDVEQVA